MITQSPQHGGVEQRYSGIVSKYFVYIFNANDQEYGRVTGTPQYSFNMGCKDVDSRLGY